MQVIAFKHVNSRKETSFTETTLNPQDSIKSKSKKKKKCSLPDPVLLFWFPSLGAMGRAGLWGVEYEERESPLFVALLPSPRCNHIRNKSLLHATSFPLLDPPLPFSSRVRADGTGGGQDPRTDRKSVV